MVLFKSLFKTRIIESKKKLVYSKEFEIDNYRVLELDEFLVWKLFNGEKFELKGKYDHNTMLVTNNKAYTLKKKIFTNTELILLPSCEKISPSIKFKKNKKIKDMKYVIKEKIFQFNNSFLQEFQLFKKAKKKYCFELNNILSRSIIDGCLTCHYTITDTSPLFNELKNTFNPIIFEGEEFNAMFDMEMIYTWEELQSKIRASEDQILFKLGQIHSIRIDGYFCLLDKDYWWSCLDNIINLILKKKISFEKIKVFWMFSIDYSEEMFTHLIKYLSKNYQIVYRRFEICDRQISLFRAFELLFKKSHLARAKFQKPWIDSIPYGIESTDEEIFKVNFINIE